VVVEEGLAGAVGGARGDVVRGEHGPPRGRGEGLRGDEAIVSGGSGVQRVSRREGCQEVGLLSPGG